MKKKNGMGGADDLVFAAGLAKADDTLMEGGSADCSTNRARFLRGPTGRVVFEKNADERRPVASVNKVMTILLDAGGAGRRARVRAGSGDRLPRAASMGGSQAFSTRAKRYPLGELLKTVIVASANDSGRRHRGAPRRGRGSVCEADERARR